MGKIFVFIGKSSSGKDTIFGEVKNRIDYKTVVGYSTRPMREGEVDGEQYFFVSEQKYKELKAAGKVIESRDYDTVHGIWSYFTADDGQIDLDNNNYLYIGTLESYEAIRDYFGAGRVVPVYIEVENGERLKRALARELEQDEPKYVEMCRRFIADEEDFSEDKIKALGIEKRFVNDDLESCISEVENYIKAN